MGVEFVLFASVCAEICKVEVLGTFTVQTSSATILYQAPWPHTLWFGFDILYLVYLVYLLSFVAIIIGWFALACLY